MAVFTSLDFSDIDGFLSDYNLGTLVSYEGIAQGVSNTNYHVFTDKGRYILTLFEERRTRRADLPYLFAYAGHLAGQGIACPQAYLDRNGEAIKTLKNKATALICFLEGRDIARGQSCADHCAQMGAFLARMHKAVSDFPLSRVNDWGFDTWGRRVSSIKTDIENYKSDLYPDITQEIEYISERWDHTLPSGAVHLDLFPDNIFFQNGQLSAMIDMYFTAQDLFIYDFSITANAWCFDAEGHFSADYFAAFAQAYHEVRPISLNEYKAMHIMMRAACMRFLVSRLEEWFAFDKSTAVITPHDPAEYLNRLVFHQHNDVTNFLKLRA